MFKLCVLSVCSAFLIYGCAPQQSNKQVTLLSSFNSSEMGEKLKKGTNTINGSALIRQSGGAIVTCAGTEASLIPRTSYSNERMAHIYENTTAGFRPIGHLAPPRVVFTNESEKYQSMIPTSMCDAQGYFSFKDVADGEYFITAIVVWSAGPHNPQGGFLMKRIKVEGGETKTIVLAP